MGRICRHTGSIAAAETFGAPLTELFGGHHAVAPIAQASDVRVDVEPAQCEGLDVIRDGRWGDDTAPSAEAAEGFISKAAAALLDRGPTSEALGHMTDSDARYSKSRQPSWARLSHLWIGMDETDPVVKRLGR